MENLKKCLALANRFAEGSLAEYSAHLIPTSRINIMPRLYTDGLLVAGDATAFVLGIGLYLEGANFAVASGIIAANAVIMREGENEYHSLY